MRIRRICVANVRNLVSVEAELGRHFNVLTGSNGAGKTSFLEAIHLLGHGRSFRGRHASDLIRLGTDGLSVFAECRFDAASSPTERLGLALGASGWSLRRNGETVGNLSDFVRTLPVVTLEPGCHELISGPSENRRRYLDWLLFHVEPEFLGVWRRYARALKQRNASLRSAVVTDVELSGWESELAESGSFIHRHRLQVSLDLERRLLPLIRHIAPGLNVSGIRVRSGWSPDLDLATALREGRSTDRERGFTQRGPHRGDWRLVLEDGLDHDQLSRGQGKLAAVACLLAQAELFRDSNGHWPVLCCDDLAAELDMAHQAALLAWLRASGTQVVMTGVVPPGPALAEDADNRMFHVEQGQVTQLL